VNSLILQHAPFATHLSEVAVLAEHGSRLWAFGSEVLGREPFSSEIAASTLSLSS
jgi:hypothetical protein